MLIPKQARLKKPTFFEEVEVALEQRTLEKKNLELRLYY